jgi:hypothetical protein
LGSCLLAVLSWLLRKQLWDEQRFQGVAFHHKFSAAGCRMFVVCPEIIKPEWISAAGNNTILGNLAGVIFGVFMYFPTLVEVPIARMFLNLGMHRGPLLAYLMADPELSLQSILITATIIGRLKAWVYVFWVALFSTLAGLIYGSWVDGASLGLILLYLVIFLVVLVGVLWYVNRHNRTRPVAQSQAIE